MSRYFFLSIWFNCVVLYVISHAEHENVSKSCFENVLVAKKGKNVFIVSVTFLNRSLTFFYQPVMFLIGSVFILNGLVTLLIGQLCFHVFVIEWFYY